MKLSSDILKTFRTPDEQRIDQLLNEEIERNQYKIIVLDDDPTGVQTVHDISVYTDWTYEDMLAGFQESSRLFYILTNSRGLTAEETSRIHHEIAKNVDEAAKATGKDYFYISRSDSTLRGHYPLETLLLKEDYEKYTGVPVDGEILCPFFKEGGRFTIGNVHYVQYGDELVPANETEFAKDTTFGYTASSLPEYIEEKTGGRYRAEDVVCIELTDLRDLNIEKIEEQLSGVRNFNKVIVNAVDDIDVKVFCIALLRTMARGKIFMFRTAASFVKILGGITDRALLTRSEMICSENGNGGLIIAGSHTNKTSRQIEELKKLDGVKFIEMDVSLVRNEDDFNDEIDRCLRLEEEYIGQGKTVCCYTSRDLITADTGNKEDDLKISTDISNAVQSLVGRLSVEPAFIIAKGGITSSDIGTKALKVRRANVLGQVSPGIPVWQTDEGSLFPMMPYVIFPGNVGQDTTLRDVTSMFLEGRI